MVKNKPKYKVDLAEHTTPFEKRLASFLTSLKMPEHLTVSDIKDIVWNAQDNNLISRLVSMVIDENPKIEFQKVLNIFQEAWNNFPHKQLNGLAPRDMVLRSSEDDDFNADARPNFFDIFSERFPEKVRISRMGKNEWQFEYPASIQDAQEHLLGMKSTMQEQSKNDFNPADTVAEMFEPFRIGMASEILKNEPLCFDAAVVCARAEFESGKPKLARQILESAIEKAKSLFPAEFTHGNDILPWGMIDNRPFLSLLAEYATFVEEVDGPLAATRSYEELLRFNPNDNQGVRGLLATAYMKTNHLEELFALDAKYPEDLTAELAVGALLALYKLKRLDEARKRVQQMKENWTHVFREILKTEHPQPELTPGRVRVGGEDEAWIYWDDQGTFWMNAPGALEFLREHAGI